MTGGERYPASPFVRVYVDLPREAHERLKQQAAAAGVSMKSYLAALIHNATTKEKKR